VINVQSAESIRKLSDHGNNVRRTLKGVLSKNAEFQSQSYCLRARAGVRCTRDEGLSWWWELLAFAVDEAETPKVVASQQDVGDIVSGD